MNRVAKLLPAHAWLERAAGGQERQWIDVE
jgi:hypothetical protein